MRRSKPDPARIGSITGTLHVRNPAATEGTELIRHCWSTHALVSAAAQFLTSRETATSLEFCHEDDTLRRDLTVGPLRSIEGRVCVPKKPGLGIALRRDAIERSAVRRSCEPDKALVGTV